MYEKTYEEIKADILSRITMTDKREGSFVQDMISPVSLELEKLYAQFDRIVDMMFVDGLAGEYLDRRAAEYGMARKDGTKAQGSIILVGTASARPPVPSTSIYFETEDGLKYFRSVTSTSTTTVNGLLARYFTVEAADIGDDYNQPSGTVVIPSAVISNTTQAYFRTAATGGTNDETDAELKARLLERLQEPATSGNASQYRQWALEVDGIGDVRVFSQKNATVHSNTFDSEAGAVLLVPVTTTKGQPSAAKVAELKNYIDALRPVGATVYTYRPLSKTLTLSATIELDGSVELSEIISRFTEMFKSYIYNCVLKLYTIDYNRCLSMFYDIAGVSSVTSCTLNNGTSNVTVYETQIPVVGTITITEAT